MARRQADFDLMTSEDTFGKRVRKRIGQLRSEKGTTEGILQQIADHVVGRGDFTTERITDHRNDYYIYDTTAINQSNRLVASMYSILFAGKWFSLGVENPRVEDDDEVAEWLKDTSLRMLAEISSPSAGFSSAMQEDLKELVDFGTSAVLVSDLKKDGLRFQSVPCGQFYVAEDGYGVVDTVYRSYRFTNYQVWQRWGEKIKDDDAREKLQTEAETKPDEKREVVHAVQPNNDGLRNMLGSTKPIIGAYVDIVTGLELEVRFFDEMPIPVSRWERLDGVPYGGSPGRNALPSAMMLNEMERTTMEQAQKAVSPPVMVPNDGTIVQFDSDPDSVISYTPDVSSQRGSGIEYLESRSRFDVSDSAMERRKNDVREAYHASMEEIPNGPYFTATHVVELSRQAVKYMGPQLLRYETEKIAPIIKRVFGVMLRNGKIDPAPLALEGQTLKVNYVSPSMRASMAEEAESVRKYRLSTIELGGVNPEAMDMLDPEESLRAEAEAYGLTPGSGGVRNLRDVAAMRQARNEASQEMEDDQSALEASQIVKNVAPALKAIDGGAG